MNSLGYKSFFASIAITLFASNSFAMNSTAQGLENNIAVQQAVEVLCQDPEVVKIASELKSTDDTTVIGRLVQRIKEVLSSSRCKSTIHAIVKTTIILAMVKHLFFAKYYYDADFICQYIAAAGNGFCLIFLP